MGDADGMTYIQDIEDQSSLRALVFQDLKDMGIKPPKSKKHKSRHDSITTDVPMSQDFLDECKDYVFGNSLNQVPCVAVHDCGPVPRFLVEACQILDSHLHLEGLFRKSGSLTRQKELRDKVEQGDVLTDENVYDICALIKQFFRELPDPLLTSRFHDTFVKCHNLSSDHYRQGSILLLSLLLPWNHLSTLRFFCKFLARVAMDCEINKMDVSNLAVCLAPNMLHSCGKGEKMNTSESRLLQIQTEIVKILIINADRIGLVSASLVDRTTMMATYFPSDDELDRSTGNDTQDEGVTQTNGRKKKKKRSGSLQGLVNNLSNSFTKWRRDSQGKHNSSNVSDKSTMISISSMDSLSCTVPNDSFANSEQNGLTPLGISVQRPLPDGATPVIQGFRKRKAHADTMPFSASKKQAILKQMPQRSTLAGTPLSTRQKLRTDYTVASPNIRFSDNGGMIFNSSENVRTKPPTTPKGRLDKLMSPTSNTKVKRKSLGQSGCFTPKSGSTLKKKRSIKGLLRRLSGSNTNKDPESTMLDGSISSQISNEVIRSNLSNMNGPPDLLAHTAGKENSMLDSRIGSPASEPGDTVKHSLTLLSANGSRRRSADGSVVGNTSLRRGRPNTPTTGLPSFLGRHNLSNDSHINQSLSKPEPPARQSSHREIFTSPERRQNLACEPSTFDISPIPKAEDDDDDDDDDDDRWSLEESVAQAEQAMLIA